MATVDTISKDGLDAAVAGAQADIDASRVAARDSVTATGAAVVVEVEDAGENARFAMQADVNAAAASAARAKTEADQAAESEAQAAASATLLAAAVAADSPIEVLADQSALTTWASVSANAGALGLVVDEGTLWEAPPNGTGGAIFRGTISTQSASTAVALAARAGGPGAVTHLDGVDVFDWRASGTADGVLTFAASGGGFWVRRLNGPLTPYDFGAVGDAAGAWVTDDTAALQSFFDFLRDHGSALPVRIAGRFMITSPLTLELSGRTKRIDWDCEIFGDGASSGYMLSVQASGEASMSGWLKVRGKGGATYANRTWYGGLHVTGAGRLGCSWTVNAESFTGWGVRGDDSAGGISLARLGRVVCVNCGALPSGLGSSGAVTITSRTDTGSSGSFAQRSVLGVSRLPDSPDLLGTVAVYDGEPYVVLAAAAGEITVFPWFPIGVTSGSLQYIEGGGLLLEGADSSVVDADMVDARACGTGYYAGALYGATIRGLTSQACGVGYALGIPPASTTLSNTILGYYAEINTFDIVQMSSALQDNVVVSTYATTYSKCRGYAPRLSTGELVSGFTKLLGTVLIGRGVVEAPVLAPPDGTSSSATDLAVRPVPSTLVGIRSNTHTIRLKDDPDRRALFGYVDVFAAVRGTGLNGRPAGTITATADAGYTVNGGAGFSLSGLTRPVLVWARLVAGNDWRVSAFTAMETAAAVTDLPTAGGSTITQLEQKVNEILATQRAAGQRA